MAFTPFASDKPNIADNGAAVVSDTRNNLMALRDAIVGGAMQNWNMSQSGGTAEEPAVILYTKGTERVRLTITWGSTGGALDNPQVVVYAYSGDSGSTWDPMGTCTATYDGSGNMTAQTWS